MNKIALIPIIGATIIVVVASTFVAYDKNSVDNEMIKCGGLKEVLKENRTIMGFIKVRYLKSDDTGLYCICGLDSMDRGCIVRYNENWDMGMRSFARLANKYDVNIERGKIIAMFDWGCGLTKK